MTVSGWDYGKRDFVDHLDDPQWLMREALRRAVDIRDKHDGERLAGRQVMLVDVLNALSESLGFDTDGDLWSEVGGAPD